MTSVLIGVTALVVALVQGQENSKPVTAAGAAEDETSALSVSGTWPLVRGCDGASEVAASGSSSQPTTFNASADNIVFFGVCIAAASGGSPERYDGRGSRGDRPEGMTKRRRRRPLRRKQVGMSASPARPPPTAGTVGVVVNECHDAVLAMAPDLLGDRSAARPERRRASLKEELS